MIAASQEQNLNTSSPVRVGETFELGSVTMDGGSMVAFAEVYDPQPFHVDEAAGAATMFGGLIASGLQTLSHCHGLAVRRGMLERMGGLAGLGFEKIRFPHPVRPGDRITAMLRTLSLRPTRGQPDKGVACVEVQAVNQHGEQVVSYELTILVKLECWAENRGGGPPTGL
jgi:acyl dehydratase